VKRVFAWVGGVLLIAAVASLPAWWNRPQAVFYAFYREQGREHTLEDLAGYWQLTGQHFVVHFTEQDRDVAEMVLHAADDIWAPVTTALGFAPEGLVPLIIYPDRQTLREAFGWSAQESAMGVYWRGIIRVLSPHAWLAAEDSDEREALFRSLGPLPHEFTHYVLDYMTAGNYPRWFTEGLAQSVEYHINGYQWVEESNRLDQPLYTLEELDSHFDDLSNQALAYRQSLCMVEYLRSQGGEARLRRLLADLQHGFSFAAALGRTYNMTLAELDKHWLDWTKQQPYLIDPD
jgi:hypothetical protein